MQLKILFIMVNMQRAKIRQRHATTMRVYLGLATAMIAPVHASYGTCGLLTGREKLFCSGVTWNASLPLAPAALDAAAKADFELALDRLHKVGGASSLPMCLESWKALQCASKFQKCSKATPAPQKVCHTHMHHLLPEYVCTQLR